MVELVTKEGIRLLISQIAMVLSRAQLLTGSAYCIV